MFPMRAKGKGMPPPTGKSNPFTKGKADPFGKGNKPGGGPIAKGAPPSKAAMAGDALKGKGPARMASKVKQAPVTPSVPPPYKTPFPSTGIPMGGSAPPQPGVMTGRR